MQQESQMSELNQTVEELNQDQIRGNLNEIFKQVVVGRDWKTHGLEVFEMYENDKAQITSALESIILKIMVIPPAQQKSASELIGIFVKVYECLIKQLQSSGRESFDSLNKVFNDHLETAFKLTIRPEVHYKNRAYQWLHGIIEVAPLTFWEERKKRVIKSIYTHAVDLIVNVSSNHKSHDEVMKHQSQPYMEFALRIALKFIQINNHRQFSDYVTVIRSNLLRILNEDLREKFRCLIIEKLDFGKDPESLGFLARRTQDHASSVRQACFQRLLSNDMPLNLFSKLDRLTLISNGLKDYDQQILETCKMYLVQQFCLKKEHRAHDLTAEKIEKEWLNPFDYTLLAPLKLNSNWDNINLSNVLKSLFTEVLIPVYQDSIETAVLDLSLSTLPSKKESQVLFEQLVFTHCMVSALYEEQQLGKLDGVPDVLDKVCGVDALEQVLQITSQSDSVIAKLSFMQGVKILWYHAALAGQSKSKEKAQDGNVEQDENQLKENGDEEMKEGDGADEAGHLGKIRELCIKALVLIEKFQVDLTKVKVKNEVDVLKEIQQDMKRTQNDMVFIESPDDLIKEVIQVLKQCDKDYIKTITDIIQSSLPLDPEEKLSSSSLTPIYSKLRLIKQCLKHFKLSTSQLPSQAPSDSDKNQLLTLFESQIKKDLELLQDPCAQSLDATPILTQKAIECLGLLMVLDWSIFDKYLDMLCKSIEDERPEQFKSKQVIKMLKTIYDGLIVHQYMVRVLPQDFQDKEAIEAKRLKLRQLLMRQMRDADLNVRYVAVEGMARLLMCDAAEKPIDSISRLMLVGFEKVTEIAGRQLTDHELEIQKTIQSTVEQFLNHYVRLSKSRCKNIAVATTQLVSYLLKVKSAPNSQTDPGFLQINIFYIFGIVTDLLKYEYNKDFGIFDYSESKRPISFQLQFLEFFILHLINQDGNGTLTSEEDQKSTSFIIDSLDFLHLDELPNVLREGVYAHQYDTLVSPLLGLLYQKLTLGGHPSKSASKVKKTWTMLALLYLREKGIGVDPDHGFVREELLKENLEKHIKTKITSVQSMIASRAKLIEQAKALSSRKVCDVYRLEDICSAFRQSMHQYRHEFSVQKVTLVNEQDMQAQVDAQVQKTVNSASRQASSGMSASFADNKKDAKKLIMGKASAYSLKKHSKKDDKLKIIDSLKNNNSGGCSKKRENKRKSKLE